MELWHCTGRLHDDRELATSIGAIRTAVSRVLAKTRPRGLVVFAVADNHVHLLLAGSRENAGETMRRLQLSFHWHLDLSRTFERARFRRVVDREHLWRTVPYILKQVGRHQIRTDPAWEGSALHDLLGMRVPGLGLRARLLQFLPRLKEHTLHSWLGVGDDVLGAWDDPVPVDHLHLVAEAAAAAYAIPTLRAPGRRGPAAIRAACGAIDPTIPPIVVATQLGVSPRTVRRARMSRVDRVAVRAVRRQTWRRVGLARTRDLLGPESLEAVDPVYLPVER